MKKICLLGVFTIFLSAQFVFAGMQQPEYELKLGIFFPEGSTWVNICHEFENYIEKESNGRIKITWYTGGVVGDEIDMIRKMRYGQLQGGGFSGYGLSRVLPEVQVLELPFLFQNYNEVDCVLDKVTPQFKKYFNDKGFIFVDWAEQGFVYYFAKVPLQTLEDVQNLKSWQWSGHAISEEIMNAFGIHNRVPLGLSDVMKSLPTVINGFYASPLVAVSFQWYTQAHYMLDTPITYGTGTLLLEKEYFNTLPDDIKKIIQAGTEKYFTKKLRSAIRSDDKVAYDGLQEYGIVFNNPSPELFNQLKSKSKNVYTNLVGKAYSKALLDDVEAYLIECRQKY